MGEVPTVASGYLRVLDAQRAALVTALGAVVTVDDVAVARRDSARLSVRLDASPLADASADAVDRGELPGPGPAAPGADHRDGAGWAVALRLDAMPTQDIAAVEYRGVRAAQALEAALADRFLDAPTATLARLHRCVADGLVAPERLGALRSTSRAVHDGAQGQVIFHAPPPAHLPELLEGLDAWVRTQGRRQLPLALAGLVHHRLLHWRPFEAGNGRLARLASRIALRASGGEPWGVAVPERVYAADRLRYATEVAATVRRADVRPWNEWTGEAIVESLERVARQRGAAPPSPDARAVRACGELAAGAMITVADVAARAGMERHPALVQSNLLCWTGLLRRDRGTHGLRYVRTAADVSIRAGRQCRE